MTLVPELNLMVFASLYRLEGKPPFSENERRYTQLTMGERMRLKFDSVVKRGAPASQLGQRPT